MAQTWFIIGSSVGLGYSIVEAPLAAGHQVVATARNPQTLDMPAAASTKNRLAGGSAVNHISSRDSRHYERSAPK
jgi:NAD(P)-dependent dehydrogenase (short-subunit alcohol dehydrogenase family)